MPTKIAFICLALALPLPWTGLAQKPDAGERQISAISGAEARGRITASPVLPFHGVPIAALPPSAGWESGAVSWVAIDKNGTIYELQRGDQADPVLVLDGTGRVLRSWGKGDFHIPHSIRLDPQGNVWTVDAGSSTVIEYSPLGTKLRTIEVGERPENGSVFNGATDIAFGPNGRIFVTDGYGNARVLEYAADGRRVRQWGKPGNGAREFHLPHAIRIDEHGTIYVADRENGRIEKFDLGGRFLGEIGLPGRVYSMRVARDAVWATVGPLDQPPGAPGWLLKLDRQTGKILGHLDITEPRGGHAVDLLPSGEPVVTLGNGLLWFKAN